MKRYIIILIFLSFCSSCKEKLKTSDFAVPVVAIDSERKTKQTIDSTHKFYFEGKEIPFEEIDQVTAIVVRHLKVVDNRFCFPLTREEFVKLGAPERYYDQVMEDLKNSNEVMKNYGIENVAEMLKSSYEDLYERYGYPEE